MRELASFRFISSGLHGVDREADSLRGVVIMEKGETREIDDRKLLVDDVTMQQYVKFASAKDGILRARFTHGDATDEGLGTYLGRWGNFRVDGDKVRQDLTLSPRSHDSPKGDLGKYILDMAESDPDMLGASMQIKFDFAAMRKERRSDGYMPIRMKAVFGADFVDTPALASGVFSAGRLLGEPDMNDGDAPQGISQEQFDAGLKSAFASFGEEITTAIMAKVDEKFSAKTQQEEGDEPTADDLRKEGAKRASEIMAFAATAGLNDHVKVAQEAIDANQSVESFKASIADRLIAQNKLSKDGDAGDGEDADPLAKFRAEFKADRVQLANLGIDDEDAYVRSRCRDEGLPVPAIKKAS